jgi:hypothetical protein
MLTAVYYFNYIGPQKLLANVGYLCFDCLAGNCMSHKHDLAVVSSYTESTISYFVDLQGDYVANLYHISFSHY